MDNLQNRDENMKESQDVQKEGLRTKLRHFNSEVFSNPIQPVVFTSQSSLESGAYANETIPNTQSANKNNSLLMQEHAQPLQTLSKQEENLQVIDINKENTKQENISQAKDGVKETQKQGTTQNNTQKSSKVFFTKTQNMLDSLTEVTVFNKEMLQKGMKIGFIQSNDSLFFKLTIGTQIHLACAYAYILDERTFLKEESPRIHITQCDEVKTIPNEFLKICTPVSNAFDYRVRSNGIDTRLFYEHPLRICQSCMIKLAKALSIKHKKEIMPNQLKEEEIINLLCKNKLKNLVL